MVHEDMMPGLIWFLGRMHLIWRYFRGKFYILRTQSEEYLLYLLRSLSLHVPFFILLSLFISLVLSFVWVCVSLSLSHFHFVNLLPVKKLFVPREWRKERKLRIVNLDSEREKVLVTSRTRRDAAKVQQDPEPRKVFYIVDFVTTQLASSSSPFWNEMRNVLKLGGTWLGSGDFFKFNICMAI